MALPELNRRKPGEWCQQCTIRTETKPRQNPDGTTDWLREPCFSALERFRKTGKGTGLAPKEPVCLASLQAAADKRKLEEKTAA